MADPLARYREKFHEVEDARLAWGIDRSELDGLDMICYRVETPRRYAELRQRFGEMARLLSESEVAGRPIAIFELDTLLEADGYQVRFLELPSPKPNNTYAEGIEHVQFVTREPLEAFLARHPELPFAVGGSEHNVLATLASDQITVKFHDTSISEVVAREENERSTQPLT